MMEKKENITDSQFETGEFVFAKMDKYKPWPAKIIQINEKTAFVYFYGVGNFSELPISKIYKFQSRIKFLSTRSSKLLKTMEKDKSFMKSLREIIRVSLLDIKLENYAAAIDLEKSKWCKDLTRYAISIYKKIRASKIHPQRLLRLTLAEENLCTLKRQKKKRLIKKAIPYFYAVYSAQIQENLVKTNYNPDYVYTIYGDDLKEKLLAVSTENAKKMVKEEVNRLTRSFLNEYHKELRKWVKILHHRMRKSGSIHSTYREFIKRVMRINITV